MHSVTLVEAPKACILFCIVLTSIGYGIGTPRDSPYRDLVTSAILKVRYDWDIVNESMNE